MGARQEPPGVAERVQSLILLCKVETRSGIDNLLNINVALMSTLHNDMLVIKGHLDRPAHGVYLIGLVG